jgi:hypothetical protein
VEIKAIALWKTQDRQHGYNIGAGGNISPALSQEVKDRIRRKLMGHAVSDVTRAKMSAAGTGRSNPHEGAAWSAETRAKHVGRHNGPCSSERRAAIIAAKKGRSNGCVGRQLSSETRMKLSAAALIREARRRSAKETAPG